MSIPGADVDVNADADVQEIERKAPTMLKRLAFCVYYSQVTGAHPICVEIRTRPSHQSVLVSAIAQACLRSIKEIRALDADRASQPTPTAEADLKSIVVYFENPYKAGTATYRRGDLLGGDDKARFHLPCEDAIESGDNHEPWTLLVITDDAFDYGQGAESVLAKFLTDNTWLQAVGAFLMLQNESSHSGTWWIGADLVDAGLALLRIALRDSNLPQDPNDHRLRFFTPSQLQCLEDHFLEYVQVTPGSKPSPSRAVAALLKGAQARLPTERLRFQPFHKVILRRGSRKWHFERPRSPTPSLVFDSDDSKAGDDGAASGAASASNDDDKTPVAPRRSRSRIMDPNPLFSPRKVKPVVAASAAAAAAAGPGSGLRSPPALRSDDQKLVPRSLLASFPPSGPLQADADAKADVQMSQQDHHFVPETPPPSPQKPASQADTAPLPDEKKDDEEVSSSAPMDHSQDRDADEKQGEAKALEELDQAASRPGGLFEQLDLKHLADSASAVFRARCMAESMEHLERQLGIRFEIKKPGRSDGDAAADNAQGEAQGDGEARDDAKDEKKAEPEAKEKPAAKSVFAAPDHSDLVGKNLRDDWLGLTHPGRRSYASRLEMLKHQLDNTGAALCAVRGFYGGPGGIERMVGRPPAGAHHEEALVFMMVDRVVTDSGWTQLHSFSGVYLDHYGHLQHRFRTVCFVCLRVCALFSGLTFVCVCFALH